MVYSSYYEEVMYKPWFIAGKIPMMYYNQKTIQVFTPTGKMEVYLKCQVKDIKNFKQFLSHKHKGKVIGSCPRYFIQSI